MKNHFYIFLTYLVLISLVILGISMSQYETTMTGSDVAVIGQAVVDYVPVSATLNGEPISASSGGINIGDLSAGSEVVYRFDIKNYKNGNFNQVLLKYKISVSFNPDPQTIPLTYTLMPDEPYQSAGDGWVILGFTSEETHSYTLRIKWNEAEIDPIYLNQQQVVHLKVDTEQTIN